MTTPEDTMRAEFEAAMGRKGYEMNPTRFRDGSYTTAYYQAGWEMWQHQAAELEQLRAQVAPASWVPFIQHVQTVADGGATWADEWLKWYSPGEWLSEERAAAVFLGVKLTPAQPSTVVDAPADNRFSWMDFQDIGNTPTVDEAIRNLLEDQTEDNATSLIRAVVEAAGKRLEDLAAQPAAQAEPRRLPTGWRIADEVTMAHLRWAAHVMGGIEPTNHDAKLHIRALNDLQKALHRMDNCPMPPAEHLWPTASNPPAQPMHHAARPTCV